jgi:hypothetical protein
MVELWLKSNNTGVWESLDTGADVSISITKSLEEIEDFQTKKSSFSKTFNIPQTEKNNKFFASAYNVNSANFGDDIVIPAVVKFGGADVFNGTCRLNKIVNSVRGGTYEIFLTQNLPSLTTTLQQIKLTDLDYSGLTHTLSYDNIVSTWSYTGGSYTNYTGLTGSIVYPLANYGYSDGLYHSLFDLSVSGLTYSGSPVAPTQFAPWISVKYLVDKMFSQAGFTYTSNFLNSDYFNGIFTIAKSNNTQGGQVASASTANANIFSVNYTRNFIEYPDGNYDELYYKGLVFVNVLNDPLNIFSPARNGSVGGRGNFFNTAVAGVYKFKISLKAQMEQSNYPGYINIAVKDVDDGTIYKQIKGITILPLGTEVNNMYVNATIPAGRRVALYYARQSQGGDTYSAIRFTYQAWELWNSPILIGDQNLLLQDNLPTEIYCLEFFKGLVDTFNLVVIPNGETSFLIERWDDYFSSGNDLDWSQKLDISTDYTLEPTSSLTQKYILTYKQNTTDRFSLINQQTRNQQFGTSILISPEPYHSGSKTIEVPFSPLPIATFDVDTPSNILIPHLYTWNEGGTTPTTQFTPLGIDLTFGFYNGLLTSEITGTTKPWYFLSGLTSVAQTTYPAISHLSSYEYSASTFSDLNFQNQYDYWQPVNDTYVGFTLRDIYGDFWGNRVQQLYANDVKLFTGTFQLTPTEINNISFNDNVYFLNAWWRLLSMNDADITNNSLVSCQFIKLPYTIGSTELIAPTYRQTPFTPQPVPTGSTYQYVMFSSTNIGSMCSETSAQIVVYSNCSILSAGCSVFSDTSATIPITEGTFVKQVGSNTIYQVIEYGILTNFTTC